MDGSNSPTTQAHGLLFVRDVVHGNHFLVRMHGTYRISVKNQFSIFNFKYMTSYSLFLHSVN